MLKKIAVLVISFSSQFVLASENETAALDQTQLDAAAIDSARVDEIKKQIALRREKLNLSDEQQAQIRPILEDNFAKQLAIFQKHGLSKPVPGEKQKKIGWKRARKIGEEMSVLRRDTRAQLDDILNETQLKEWDKLQKEQRARGRAMIQKRLRQNR